MNFENLMLNRRSIREYDSRPVSNKEIEKMINAARWAPSSGNSQDLRYIVVKKKDVKERLAEASYEQDWMIDAPVIIVVCSKKDVLEIKFKDRAKGYSFSHGGAAIQNMLLMATELGLGSCWVGAFDSERVRTMIKVPKNVRVIGMVTIGHYSKSARIPLRMGLKELIFLEEWGKK